MSLNPPSHGRSVSSGNATQPPQSLEQQLAQERNYFFQNLIRSPPIDNGDSFRRLGQLKAFMEEQQKRVFAQYNESEASRKQVSKRFSETLQELHNTKSRLLKADELIEQGEELRQQVEAVAGIGSQHQARASLSPAPPAPRSPAPERPDTSESIRSIRRKHTAQVEAYQHENDDDERAMANIPVQTARNWINSNKQESSLGCWEAPGLSKFRTGSADSIFDDGYIKVNFRNSVGSNGEKINFSPFAHQIALVAEGRYQELRATLKGRAGKQVWECSHLCHNMGCFNPRHIIVESRRENKYRQTCFGQQILVYRGVQYNPCQHYGGSAKRECILPVKNIDIPGFYRNRNIYEGVDMSSGDGDSRIEKPPVRGPMDAFLGLGGSRGGDGDESGGGGYGQGLSEGRRAY